MTKSRIAIVILLILSVLQGFYSFHLNKRLEEKSDIGKIESFDSGHYVNVNADREIGELKKENKALYDSIKSYKKQVSFLTQFKYKKEYKIDTVYIQKLVYPNDTVKTYTYANKDNNDSLKYKLSIGSVKEPNWYKIDISVSDKFTIINRKDFETNQTTIDSENGGDIQDVTVFNKKTKSFWDRFGIGPTVNVGYGIYGKRLDVNVGVGITYDLTK